MEVKKILILRGLQGSGKSTFARQWVDEDPNHRVRFNRDDVRNMLGKYWVPEREEVINQMYVAFLDQSMVEGYDIVIDNMNLNQSYIDEINKIVEEFNSWLGNYSIIKYEVEIKDFFHIPLQTCIDRDAQREHPIGENVIRRTYNKYKDKIPAWKYLR